MELRKQQLANRRTQAIGANPDAVRMKRVVNFYEKLPRGPAPEVKATGILGRYQAKHFGKNPTGKRMWPSQPGSRSTRC
jgi:hypothetical protein